MKRMRFFVVLTLLFFALFGGSLSPQKAFAALTEADKTATAGLFESIDPMVLPGDSSGSWFHNTPPLEPNRVTVTAAKNKFISIVQESFDVLKADPSKTIADLRLRSYATYSTFLDNVLTGLQQIRPGSPPSDTDKAYITLLKGNTDSALMMVGATVGVRNGTMTVSQQQLVNAQAQANQTAVVAGVVAQTATDANGCTNLTNFSIMSCINKGVAWIITHTLLGIAGWFLWVTATMMNYAISIGILRFSEWAPSSLYPLWVAIRQIVSLFVVFAGLWLTFMYILNKSKDLERYTPWLIMFALFVNFSYPLVRTVIDISNVISLNIYASAVGSDALTASTISISDDKTAGAIIRDRLGLKGLVDFATSDSGGSTSGISLNAIDNTPSAILAVLYIGYAAWIFFLVSALIIMRTAVLVFLIVASPLLFVDAVVPYLGDEAKKLRGIFWEMLFVGPVFAIMLALTLKFLEVFQDNGLLSSKMALGASSGEAIKMFFNILMMLIMLHIMLKVTKATSGKIGATVSEAMGKVGGFAVGGVALGGTGMLGRATIGRGAAMLRDSKWMENRQGGFLGRHMYNMTDSVAKSGFDPRNSSYVQAGAKKLGMGIGMGQKMGREALIEARDKNLEAHLNRIGTHKKNIYEYTTDENGKQIQVLKSKKGSLDTSASAQEARSRYIGNAGGALFATKQEKEDLKYNLGKSNTDQERTKTNEKIAVQNKAVSDYSKLSDPEAKKKFADAQDAETQARIREYESKKVEEAEAKRKEKEDRDTKHKETIEAMNRNASAQEKAIEALVEQGKGKEETAEVIKKASESAKAVVAGNAPAESSPSTTSAGGNGGATGNTPGKEGNKDAGVVDIMSLV